MNLIFDPLTQPFFIRAMVASAIVGLVCATVGSYMVLRGLAFMGDALSHSAFPGVVVAFMLKAPFYLGASIAAVATAFAIGWVTRQGKLRGDTAIGVLFAGMFALGVFLYSLIPNYVGDLIQLLFGEVLGIGLSDLVSLVVLAAIVLAIVALLWKELLYSTFDPLGAAASGLPVGKLDYLLLALIALTIVISLQSVGVILVVAMLVTPAATAQLVSNSFGRLVVVAAVIGILSPIVGLYISYWANSASGATIVLVETAVFVVVQIATSLLGRYRHAEAGARAAQTSSVG
jgi:ABC-type Mn2+/Zn2+ transport system permease subunit